MDENLRTESQIKQAVSIISALVAEAQRIEEDTLYSSKNHFEEARKWNNRHLWIGIPTTIIAVLAGVTAIKDYLTISAILSFCVAANTALFTFLNPKERATLHLKAGNAYNALRNDARIFREIDCLQEKSTTELSKRLNDLHAQRSALNADSPQPSQDFFYLARKGIESGEANYAVDNQNKNTKIND